MAPRTLIGDFGGGDYRIRMSKPGFDVTAALDPEKLALDSSWKDGGVVYRTGTVVMPSPGFVDFSFGETLPSIPFVVSWERRDSTTSLFGTENTTDNIYRTWHCIASTTGLSIAGDDFEGRSSITVAFMVIRSLTNG